MVRNFAHIAVQLNDNFWRCSPAELDFNGIYLLSILKQSTILVSEKNRVSIILNRQIKLSGW